MKKVLRLIVYIALLCLILSYFKYGLKNETIDRSQGHAWENYDSTLLYQLRSVNDLINYADASLGKDNRQTLDYVQFLSKTISFRFYHSYSTYTFQQNWISYLSGQFIWSNLNAVVIPDDIMKYPYAACSQVSIVLAAALKKIGVPYRKVGLKGHFALEANVDGKWYFFDANLEPHFPKGIKSLDELIRNKELYLGYEGHISLQLYNNVFSTIDYGKPNEALAPNATIFHRVTFLASILLPFALVIYILVDLSQFIFHKRNTLTTVKKGKSIRLNI
ncbi:hypothetical protein [Flavisolibacter tropicus]|uniref:Transglutaminase-like domain-containing protein n=1 Tax=Flavisolibacter tropicus TaxID=1492898 RepID=A0A172U0E3_9BACT|nr:hypothetical protein [Flavisolibacter tropicus]ANE52457.1 hypothetical protein SY85_20200 [Flavisolibacter tropicus]